MFDLEAQIKQWRAELSRTGLDAGEVVDELEAHLRERVDRLSAALPPAEAFAMAARELGDGKTLKREFSKARGVLRIWRDNPMALKLVGGWLFLTGLNCLSQAVWLGSVMPGPFISAVRLRIAVSWSLLLGLQIVAGIGLLRHGRFWRFCAIGFLLLDGFSSIWGLVDYVRSAAYASHFSYYTFMGITISLRFRCVTDGLTLGMALYGLYVLSRPAIRERFRPAAAR